MTAPASPAFTASATLKPLGFDPSHQSQRINQPQRPARDSASMPETRNLQRDLIGCVALCRQDEDTARGVQADEVAGRLTHVGIRGQTSSVVPGSHNQGEQGLRATVSLRPPLSVSPTHVLGRNSGPLS